jgi:hypothetical protein
MIFRATILVLMTTSIVVACDRPTWPPNQAQLGRLFDQQKATFALIEQEMAADGLLRMACGSCSIHLERDWILEYNWFPANPDDEAREC